MESRNRPPLSWFSTNSGGFYNVLDNGMSFLDGNSMVKGVGISRRKNDKGL